MTPITFATGEIAQLGTPIDCGLFRTVVATRPSDGLKRIVFLNRDGSAHPDPWLLPDPATTAALYRINELVDAARPASVTV